MFIKELLMFIILLSIVESAPFEDSDFFKNAGATLGVEMELNVTNVSALRTNIYYPIFYNLPIHPIEIELDFVTLAMQKDDSKYRISFLNMLLMPAAICPGMLAGNDDGFLGFGPIGFIFALPQLATNFKFHYPLVTDHLNVYIGEATDYYVYGKDSEVFTASKIGIKLMFKDISFDVALNKPWLKAYLENDEPYINVNIGYYMSRKKFKKMEKESREEREKSGILGPDWKKKKE